MQVCVGVGLGFCSAACCGKSKNLLRTLKSKDVIVSGRRSGALPGSCHWGSRRETGKAQWHLKASPSAEQGCLLATSHNWWMEQKEPGWGARVYLECSRELWLALTADLPRLLIMLPYDVILTHRKALTELYVGHGSACKELGSAFIWPSSGPVLWPW